MYFNVGNLHCQLDNTAFVSLWETVYNWKGRKHCKNVVEATFLPNAVLAFFSQMLLFGQREGVNAVSTANVLDFHNRTSRVALVRIWMK